MSETKATEPSTDKEPKKTRVEKRDVKRKFWFPINDKEKSELMKLSLELDRQVDADRVLLLADIEKFSADKKARTAAINDKERNRKDINHHIRVSKELREVEAIEVRDYGKKEVRYVVGKTVMEQREMTADELQTSFNLEKRNKERASEKTSANQSKAEVALRAEAEAFRQKKTVRKLTTKEEEIQQEIREETSKLTKKSAVDSTPAPAAAH